MNVLLEETVQYLGHVALERGRAGRTIPGHAVGDLGVLHGLVDETQVEAPLDPVGIDFDTDADTAVEHDAAEHAETAGDGDALLERTAELHLGERREGLVGSLNGALGSDVAPRPCRHLAVHHEALRLEFVEVLERAPVRHQHGVRDQDTRRPFMGLPDGDRLSRLDDQGLEHFDDPESYESQLRAALPRPP